MFDKIFSKINPLSIGRTIGSACASYMIKTSMLKWHKGQSKAYISPTSGDVHLCMKGKIFNEKLTNYRAFQWQWINLLQNVLLVDSGGVINGDVGAISNISSILLWLSLFVSVKIQLNSNIK